MESSSWVMPPWSWQFLEKGKRRLALTGIFLPPCRVLFPSLQVACPHLGVEGAAWELEVCGRPQGWPGTSRCVWPLLQERLFLEGSGIGLQAFTSSLWLQVGSGRLRWKGTLPTSHCCVLTLYQCPGLPALASHLDLFLPFLVSKFSSCLPYQAQSNGLLV